MFTLYESDRSGAYYRLLRDLVRRERERWKPTKLPLELRLVEELPDDGFTGNYHLYGNVKDGPVAKHPFTRADDQFGKYVRLVIALDEP